MASALLLPSPSTLFVLDEVEWLDPNCREREKANALQPIEIDIPSLVVIDDEDVDPIPLNCHFKDDHRSEYLVAKWMKDNNVIFQYIKGHGTSVIPEFKDEVTSLTSDPDNEHSGILLVNPSTDTSGIYRCHVQTKEDSLSKEKKLHIIDIRNYTLTLKHNRIQNETQLQCIIENVFPEPILNIQSIEGEPIEIVGPANTSLHDDGKFSKSSIAVLRTDDESDYEYQCIVTFGDLSFNLTTNVQSSSISFRNPKWWFLFLLTASLALVTYEQF